MNRRLLLGFIGSILLISLAGICVADDAPSYQVYIQGGESSITNGSDEAYIITVKDITPYFHIADNEESNLIPVDRLNNQASSLNAALVLAGDSDESVFMVRVINMSLSDGNKILTLKAEPLEYYDGVLLNLFNQKKQEIDLISDNLFIHTGVYLESMGL